MAPDVQIRPGQGPRVDERVWYAPWQRGEHAIQFDFRNALDDRNLIRIYETLNDVRLLRERVDRSRRLTLFEVGCATGNFRRYLRLTYPLIEYYGTDISQPAIERAQARGPSGRFVVSAPGARLTEVFRSIAGREQPEILYAKDVMHHQAKPLEFLSELLTLPSEALILRCRTRDVGATEWDPEKSKQYHYEGWVPYIMCNFHELVEFLQQHAAPCEIVIYRSYAILGERYGRMLPPECALPHTGTAETAVGVFYKTSQLGRVTIKTRPDNRPNTTWDYKLNTLIHRVFRSAREGA